MGTPYLSYPRSESSKPLRLETLDLESGREFPHPLARFQTAAVLGIFALLGATCLTFSSLLSARTIPTYRDLLFFTWPLKHFLRERLLQGQLPLWNPLLLMGAPYLANLQSGVFYPPSLLLLLPVPLGFNLFLFSHYVIALLGAWLWLRARKLTVVPAAVGTAVFVLGGYLVSLLNLTNHLQAAVWAPWVLYCWGRFESSRRSSDLFWFVAAVSMEILGGSPENLLLTIGVAAAWTAYRHLRSWQEMMQLALCLVLASMAAAALCAVQLLPTLEYLGQSSRAASMWFSHVATHSLQPVSALQLLLPHSTALLPPDAVNSLGPGFEGEISLIQSYYLGAIPLCLAIVGIAAGRERWLWSVLIVVSVLLALGTHAPFFPALYQALPWIVGKFRYPEKFVFIVHLSAVVLAAEGARLIVARRPAALRIARTAGLCLLFTALILCSLRWLWPAHYLELIAILRGRYLPASAFVPLALDTYWKAQRLALLLGVFLSLLVLQRRALRPITYSWLLLALVLGDLTSANRNLNEGMSWASLEEHAPLIDPSEARRHGERIFHGQTIRRTTDGPGKAALRLTWWVPMITRDEDLDKTYRALWETLNSNAGMFYGVANVSGSDGITSAHDDLLLQVMGELPLDRAVKLLSVLGAGYVLGPDPLPAINVTEIPPDRETPYHAFRVHDPLPLVYGVSHLRVAPSQEAALFLLGSDDFRSGREAVVESLPMGWQNGTRDAMPAAITMLARTDGSWRFRVDTSASSFIVVNESFFPGWEARVDGALSTIIRTNAIVRGIAVGAGSHLVELDYRPRSFRWGAAISLTTALVITLAALRARCGHTRQRQLDSGST